MFERFIQSMEYRIIQIAWSICTNVYVYIFFKVLLHLHKKYIHAWGPGCSRLSDVRRRIRKPCYVCSWKPFSSIYRKNGTTHSTLPFRSSWEITFIMSSISLFFIQPPPIARLPWAYYFALEQCLGNTPTNKTEITFWNFALFYTIQNT